MGHVARSAAFLGYHAKRDEKTLESYSRDSQAGPLRQLEEVVRDVRAKKFVPDATRSGLFPKRRSTSASSSSSSASSRSCSSDGPSVGAPEGGSTASEDVDPSLAHLLAQDTFIRNSSSGKVHVRLAAGELVCGTPLPVKFATLECLPAQAKLCRGCF